MCSSGRNPIPLGRSIWRILLAMMAMATCLERGIVRADEVRLGVYDVAGRRVRSLWRGRPTAASMILHWDGRDDMQKPVASGVYFYVFRTGATRQVVRTVLIR